MTHLQTTTSERRLVRVHAWLIVLTTAVVLGLAAFVMLSLPQEHVAEAEVEVMSRPTRGAPVPPTMGTERRVALSGSVATEAADRMGLEVEEARKGLSVSVVTDSEVLVIRYSSGTSEGALQGAEAFTRSFVAARNARYRTPTVEVITDPTVLPAAGGGTRPLLLLGAAALLGLGLGTGLAFLWDRLSDRVRSAGELVRTGVPVLVDHLVVRGDDRWDGRAPGASEHGYLASRIGELTQHRCHDVRIVVTSPRDSSGIAPAAAVTAAALAASGRQVVLVDPTGQHDQLLPVPGRGDSPPAGGPGLGDVLRRDCSPSAAMRPTALEGLRVVGRGAAHDLQSADVDSVRTVLTEMSSGAVVVLAGPPLLASGPAWLLAAQADLVLLVAEPPRLRRRDARRVGRMLSAAGLRTAWWLVLARGGPVRAPDRPPAPPPRTSPPSAGIPNGSLRVGGPRTP